MGGVSIPVGFAGLTVTPGKIRSISPCRATFRPAAPCVADFRERRSERAHVYLHRPEYRRHRLRPDRLYHAAVAEPGSGWHLTSGGFSISQSAATDPSFGTIKSDLIGGAFTQITGFQLPSTSAQNYSYDHDRELPGDSLHDHRRQHGLGRQFEEPRRRHGHRHRTRRYEPDQSEAHGRCGLRLQLHDRHGWFRHFRPGQQRLDSGGNVHLDWRRGHGSGTV